MHDIRQKLPLPKVVFSPQIFFFHPSFPGGVSTPMLVPSSNEAKNLGEIYLRYKYRWLIVTTNTFARISSGTESSDLSRQSWKERKGSWITGAQSTWPAPPPKRFIEILEFVSQILAETSRVWYLRYEISFFFNEGEKKNVFPGGEL